jgi:hypothetical protein
LATFKLIQCVAKSLLSKVLRVELQGQLLAQLILRCQGEVAITYTERELVMVIMQ